MRGWKGWHHDKIWGFHPGVTTGDDRNVGQKAADQMKRILATWTALIAVLCFITAWMLYNSRAVLQHHAFDPYPWILLNLCLSCFAALQCFVLLIANKRGEQIAAEIAQHTLENTDGIKQVLSGQDTVLAAISGDTCVLHEIHAHVTALTEAKGLEVGQFDPDNGIKKFGPGEIL